MLRCGRNAQRVLCQGALIMQPVPLTFAFNQDDGKGGVEFKGCSLHDGFGGFDGFCRSFKGQHD